MVYLVLLRKKVTLRGLDPLILFVVAEKDAPVKPGQGAFWGGQPCPAV